MITSSVLRKLKAARPRYKWKVQDAKHNNVTCVAYIDARQVMDLLDDIIGPENWQDHYREVAGKVYCDLSLRVNEEWVTKSDCGTASQFEADKGQASDAFKRAAVKWGVGRFLYELDIVRIKETTVAGKDSRGNDRHVPTHQGKRIWDLTEHIYKHRLAPPPPPADPEPAATAEQRKTINELRKSLGFHKEELLEYIASAGSDWKALDEETAARIIDDFKVMLRDRQAAA